MPSTLPDWNAASARLYGLHVSGLLFIAFLLTVSQRNGGLVHFGPVFLFCFHVHRHTTHRGRSVSNRKAVGRFARSPLKTGGLLVGSRIIGLLTEEPQRGLARLAGEDYLVGGQHRNLSGPWRFFAAAFFFSD